VPCCAWRARSGVHAVMIAHCAVVAAVRDVVRACGACVSVFCMRVCDVRCVGCRRALSWVTRAMTLPCRCAGWGLSRRVCLRAIVRGVMVAGSVALLGMCVRCALGLAKMGGIVAAIRAMCNARLGRVSPALSRAQ
jgi:hypothetical protein